jgi:c-Rel proto-oncogene protein
MRFSVAIIQNEGIMFPDINVSNGIPSTVPQPDSRNPSVTILEHPAPKALRFRYECEGRSAGSIPGENSTNDNKTYPTIQVNDYQGRAVVVVSCVTKDAPYK